MNEHNSNKENCKALIPHLRFPEFKDSGKWEVEEVGNVFEVTRGYVLPMNLVSDEQSESNPFPVYSSQTKNNGLAGYYKDFLYEDAITWTTDGANAGDVNFRKGKFYCTNVCGVLINKNGYSNHCVAAIINSVAKKYVSYVGNPKLMNGVMSKIKIPLPSLPEQQKIATCLSSIDEVIAGERQRLERLKAHKKGLLQNLFPREGETVPKFRFPEFKDSGEWEYNYGNELFEQIVNKKHNSNLPILAITQEYGAVPREMIDYFISVTDKSIQSYKVVEIGDFIISLRSFQGGIEFSRYKGLCSPAYIILRNKVDLVKDFYRHYFKTPRFIKDLNKNIEGIRDGKMVSYKQFSEILIPYPSLPEQQKIASCLSSLDDLIQSQEQKIALLEQHKKGLLQGLFPNVNDVDNG